MNRTTTALTLCVATLVVASSQGCARAAAPSAPSGASPGATVTDLVQEEEMAAYEAEQFAPQSAKRQRALPQPSPAAPALVADEAVAADDALVTVTPPAQFDREAYDRIEEKLADHGNGNYAYIDTVNEARKVLVHDLSATLMTIAKDVKIQVEFNPRLVTGYRLVGYENRKLADRDFNDDTKDAGEIGAGHSVTALYEVVPVGVSVPGAAVDALKVQSPRQPSAAAASSELLTVKLRDKAPTGTKSQLLSVPVQDARTPLAQTTDDFRFSAAVAAFGMLLRDSAHKGDASYEMVRGLARGAQGEDPFGYRREFIGLVSRAARL